MTHDFTVRPVITALPRPFLRHTLPSLHPRWFIETQFINGGS